MVPDQPRRRRERALIVLGVAALLFAIVAWARPREVSGLRPESFWQTKMEWLHVADIVIAGDSRTCLGVAPSAFAADLPGRRVLNFAFDNVSFSPAYLHAVEQVLDPASASKVIVLGVGPHLLSARSRDRFGYLVEEHKHAGTLRRLKLPEPAWLYYVTEPIPIEKAVFSVIAPGLVSRHEREYAADGWLASRLTPERPDEGLKVSRRWFKEGGVDPAVIDTLTKTIADWRARGIAVYGFRPPTAPALTQLEDRLAGYDEKDIEARFTAAGGRWLAPAGDYHTFDSSHLDRDGAVAFSRDLAAAVSAAERAAAARPPEH